MEPILDNSEESVEGPAKIVASSSRRDADHSVIVKVSVGSAIN
jgi:hypothetical protein